MSAWERVPMKASTTLALALCLSGPVAAAGETTMLELDAAESFAKWVEQAGAKPALGSGCVGLHGGNAPSKAKIEHDTEVRAVVLPDGLGFLIRCLEPQPGQIKAGTPAGRNDRAAMLREDDFVEVYLDPNRDGQKAFGVAVNPNGAMVDAVYYAREWVDAAWSCGATPRVERGKDAWTVSLRIPFASLGVTPSAGDVVGLAVHRVRRASETPGVPFYRQVGASAWPRGQAYFSWNQRRRVLDPWFFAPVLLGGAPDGPLVVRSRTRGCLSTMPEAVNVFAAQIANTADQAKTFRFEVWRGREELDTRVVQIEQELPAGQTRPVAAAYEPLAGGSVAFRVYDAANGRLAYDSRASRTFDIPRRIHDLRGEYDEDLVRSARAIAAPIAHFTFPQPLDDAKWTDQCLAFALPYSLEQVGAEMGRRNIAAHTTIRNNLKYNNLPDRAELFRRHGVKSLFYPDFHLVASKRPGGLAACPYLVDITKNSKGGQSVWNYRPLPCDAFKADYFAALDEGLKRYPDLIFAVFVADELNYYLRRGLKEAWSSPQKRKRHPAVVAIDRDIRKRFGFGRYGLLGTDTPPPDAPLCKIAMQRWLNDWTATFVDEVARHVKAFDPKILVVSDDPQGQVFPYDYGWRWKNVDIVTHQTGDKAVESDLGTAVLSKVVTDFCPGKEYWPCAHIEGALALYDLEETREILSRAFRNGATGIATYNLDWGGRIRGTEDMLAPGRWAYVNQIAAFYAAGKRARLPAKPKVAALYSSYSAMATYSAGIGGVYNLLGPGSGAYSRFVDDLAVERGDVDLSKFPVVVAYAGPYESPQVVRKLVEAVRDHGVTLVVADSEALRLGPDGAEIAARKLLLGGTTFGAARRGAKVGPGRDAAGPLKRVRALRLRAGRSVHPPEGAKTLLKYAEGSAACVAVPLGGGRVIWFGFNPFHGVLATIDPDAPSGFDYGDEPIADPLLFQAGPAGAFFRLFLQYLDVPTNEPIWRLKLPAPKWSFERPTSFCLTGNAILWRLSRPHSSANLPAIGRYRYSARPAADAPADADGWVPLTAGRLTDRVRAVRDLRKSPDCVAVWKNPEALSVELDLGFAAAIERVDVYVHGWAPPCRLLGGADGQTWRRLADGPPAQAAPGVTRLRLPCGDGGARFLRLDVGARPKGKTLTLAEIDVWGRPLER